MKRFTETTKWDDPWFMDLPLKYKLFWLYICDKCDNAGAWQPNVRLAIAQIGEPLELSEILRIFGDRITQLGDGKLFITKFIPFQYGNLSPNCRAHIPILNNIEKLRVSKGYPKGIHTLMEKETEKEKDKKGSAEGKHPTLKDAVDFLGSETIGTEFFDYYESNGWRVGRNPMKDWKAAARRWKRTDHSKQSQTLKPWEQKKPDPRDEKVDKQMAEAHEKTRAFYARKGIEI